MSKPSTHQHASGKTEYALNPPDEDVTVDGLEATALGTETPATVNKNVCPAGAPERKFKVHAIQVPIVYNAYGQYDPNGVIYVLDEDLEAVQTAVAKTMNSDGTPKASIETPDPSVTVPLVEPLTLRAHQGDCVEITFVNHLDRHASIHPTGLSYDPKTSGGMAVGRNGAGSVAEPDGQDGSEVHYRWYAEKQGAYAFADGANPVMHDGDETLKQHGLFGSLIVHKKGSKWLDPKTGEPLRSGTQAIIDAPENDADYREFVIYYHDSAGIVNADGSTPTFPNGEEQSLYTLNYRGDPVGARLAPKPGCKDCTKPELFYSSWVHGDPGGGDLVFPAYVGDSIKYRIIGAQAEEKHVHHHHGHRWKSEPGDPNSRTEDAQTISTAATYTQEFVAGFGQFTARPGMSYDEAFAKGGAGYVQGSPGDYIFHCHLFPHYASGMWAILRVQDKAQGDLLPLPDRNKPATPTDEEPGFPYFVKEGLDRNMSLAELRDGEAPPQAPLSPNREPTAIERSAIDGAGISDPIKPGAPYVDACPADAPVREYNISVFKTKITYNDAGDYDPNAYVYALEKDRKAIQNGEIRPRPLAIRANLGECVQITMNNHLPANEEPNMISMHVHFVGYDVLGSDGVNLGYNYLQGAEPGEQINYRWYADEEGTIFWHDHLSGFEKGMHGTFGALVVEPKGSKWFDPHTGKSLDDGAGTKAMIDPPNGESYREFVLFWQDFVRLFDRNGNPINPPQLQAAEGHQLRCGDDPIWCSSLEDQGVMGINYANAPLYHRDDEDPAYAFSSWAHGDPQTPLLETYPNEKVKVRVLQGSFEEAHTFTMHGVRWHQEEHDPQSPYIASQTLGVSEQFEAHFETPEQNPLGVRMSDYWYGSTPVDDAWNGMWGMMRVWGTRVPHLQPLPGSASPNDAMGRGKYKQLQKRGLRMNKADPGGKGKGKGKGKATGKKSKSNAGPTRERGSSTPPKAPKLGDSCPVGAPTRTYDVVAFTQDIPYNEEYGDHDPYGVMFATREDYRAIKEGTKDPEPLVIRANAEECIEVTLENKLPNQMSQHTDHAVVPVNQDWHNSNRISLHPQLVKYDVQLSDGATVGFNWDQTVGPGERITYRWYADEELGTTVLWDMADVRSHRHHGAYGLLIIEPKESQWRDPYTGSPITSGAQAVIIDPNGEDFREYAVAATDGTYIVNPDGTCPVRPGHEADLSAPCNQAIGDPEDQGFKAINFRAEPLGLDRRMKTDGREHLVFSSDVHGDPATPLFEAFAGDPVRFRVAQTADKPRGVSFHLAGHVWPHHWTEAGGPFDGAYGLTSGESLNAIPVGGAGGPRAQSGDYYYGASKLRGYVEGGMWGIFRVHPDGTTPETGLMEISAVAQSQSRPTLTLHKSTQNALDTPMSGTQTMKLIVTSEAAVDRVWIEVDDGALMSAGVLQKKGQYAVELDTTALADGRHKIVFSARDVNGQQTDVVRYVDVDNSRAAAIDGVPTGTIPFPSVVALSVIVLLLAALSRRWSVVLPR